MSMTKKEGTNLEDVQEMNRALVIRLLRKFQVCSRADIAKATGLKKATITYIINDLIEWGLVKETGIIDGEKGRRSIGITLNSENYKVIGVRLARKYFTVGLFDIAGTEYVIKTDDIDIMDNSEITFQKIKAEIRELINSTTENIVLGIGVAIPGPFIRDEGRIALMTEFPGWEKVAIKEELQKTFGVPVYLEHDANAGALAEWWFGPKSMHKGTFIYVAAGQGIGAGIILDDRIFTGALGIAGEIGHMSIDFNGPDCECGNKGCLEHYSSTLALMREVKNEIKNYPKSVLNKGLTIQSILKAVRDGDELAVKVFRETAWYLGFGLSSVVNAFNPDVIIIGDDLAEGGPMLLEVVRETMKKHVLKSVYEKLSIDLSTFRNDPVLLGASTLAVDKILRRPSIIQSISIS